MRKVWWWARWLVLYFPGAAIRRIGCQHLDLYEGEFCMRCFAPWVRYDRG